MADDVVSGEVLTHKAGPLPIVVWVIGGAGVVFLFVLLTHKGSSGAAANTTNQISALAPSEAEAFGTIEQQQQDVTNALTTLGNNQSALGGSISTLSGTMTNQFGYTSAQFANLLAGQSTLAANQNQGFGDLFGALTGDVAALQQQLLGLAQQGTDTQKAQAQYYASLIGTVQNYGNSLGSQLNGINSGLSGQQQSALQTVQTQLAALAAQVTGVQNTSSAAYNQATADAAAQQLGFSNMQTFIQGQTGYLSNLDQAGINATWSQYNTLMHELHAPGY